MLVSCQSCASQVSDAASFCPKCSAEKSAMLGAARPCKECGDNYVPAYDHCNNCGAPRNVAIGPESSSETIDASVRPQPNATETLGRGPAQSRATGVGHASSVLVKVMGCLMIAAGVLLTWLAITTPFVQSWNANYSSGYKLGQLFIAGVFLAMGVRAFARRHRRTGWDIAGSVLLLLLAGVWTFSTFQLIAVPGVFDTALGMTFVGFYALFVVVNAVVALHLLSKPEPRAPTSTSLST